MIASFYSCAPLRRVASAAVPLVLATLLVSSCADAPASQRGAGVGAALGSGIALATGAGAAGVIGGALIGGSVGYAGGWAAGGN